MGSSGINAGGFYVPCNTDHFYTMFYHSVVHKRAFVYVADLLPMALNLTLVSAEFTAALREANLAMALRAIGTYMDTLGYLWTKPNDPAVFFRPHNHRVGGKSIMLIGTEKLIWPLPIILK